MNYPQSACMVLASCWDIKCDVRGSHAHFVEDIILIAGNIYIIMTRYSNTVGRGDRHSYRMCTFGRK